MGSRRPTRRVSVGAVALLAACSGGDSSPPPVSPPSTSTSPGTSTISISITGPTFGPLRSGAALSEADIRRAFPGATLRPVTGEASTFLLSREEDGLRAVADPGKIVIEGGDVDVFGIHVGDDAARLPATPFRDAACGVEADLPHAVSCGIADGVSLHLRHCPAPLAAGEIALEALVGCKVTEIWWFAVLPEDE